MKSKSQLAAEMQRIGASIAAWAGDGFAGTVWHDGRRFAFICSWGMDWEHVSVSTSRETPRWKHMVWFKDLFWPPDEAVMQLHPPRGQYVNVHKHCLHLWRPIGVEIPMPPVELVGPLTRQHAKGAGGSPKGVTRP